MNIEPGTRVRSTEGKPVKLEFGEGVYLGRQMMYYEIQWANRGLPYLHLEGEFEVIDE